MASRWKVSVKLLKTILYKYYQLIELFQRHYPATLDQVLEDGTCTVIFDGFKTNEITQVF